MYIRCYQYDSMTNLSVNVHHFRYDQYDNIIVEEKRDFLNNVVWVRVRTKSGEIETIEDEEELAAMDITEETVSIRAFLAHKSALASALFYFPVLNYFLYSSLTRSRTWKT